MNRAIIVDAHPTDRAADVASRKHRGAPRKPAVLAVGATDRRSLARPSWWQWLHLLSLDAPLVALVWQNWWARAARVTLPPSRQIILGLGVWLIYLTDRLADSHVGGRIKKGAARHVFSAAHRHLLQPLALLVALALMTYASYSLPAAEFQAGLILLGLAVGYFWLIHRWPGRGWSAHLPKEAMVAGMFGAGVFFFVTGRSSHLSGTLWLSAGLFTALCFLNCGLITKWEDNAPDLREGSSLLMAFPRLTAHLGTACLLLATAAIVLSAATASLSFVPLAASALLLATLDRCAKKMTADGLRVLADVVLLTPLLGLAYLAAVGQLVPGLR